ncbi:hypothetical protein CLAFUW4_00372 [Fulvia fulva]|uniref:Leucine rich repeat domain-containing protein n=1 Tax=Passalora fulva TaxID=5499 RepID=A0A9Q8L5I4_PASFU|nr:uncharacterized protein CLAFUR5_00372 [Fulvia fulva]KAK4635758.1 hypothetical protein CLAFUR4_00372 [Fulvia fulva]KAK4638677.1 hypothetical protein CLAFUR0_00372 [Fulvia fulva]UJO11187.1 hypothetical protein CLAFUR5_00372 [Fulvia fulva]WPV09123.1 hypothetical protein CLAFUW4_00372 [Fulvia fulva]WPV24233.1 hypothetical protein CLAFUW7_00376 [Fulvia fulva]
MDSEDGQLFVKNLAYFVRTHEKALANALQLQRQKPKNGKDQVIPGSAGNATSESTTVSLAQALSKPSWFFSQTIKPAKLTLTPHHLFYLLSKFEDLNVDVGPMTVRLENLHSDSTPSNYISFLGHAPKSKGKQSDAASIQSTSSMKSYISVVSNVWSNIMLSSSIAKAEKQEVQYRDDIRYLCSCFTKIPALRLAPDHRARLISGYEEFPFDTAVPLFVFKNLSSLEVCDLDFRQFHGWDRLADQLRSLTVKRGGVDDPIDLLQNIVLDDAGKRRKRSSKAQVPTTPSTSGLPWPSGSPKPRQMELARSISTPTSPLIIDQRRASIGSPRALARGTTSDGTGLSGQRQPSNSPPRPATSRHGSLHKGQLGRASTPQFRRSSGSSGSSQHEMTPRHSSSDLLAMGILPSSKWRFLRHLSLAENGLTSLDVGSLAPIAGTLQSLDLSGNLFSQIPDALASLTHLRALNLSNCMIDSLSSLSKNPLPAITTLNLRSNRLLSLAGIERLYSLERLDVRDNRLHDPTELARLTGIPNIREIYVIKNPFTRTHRHYRVTVFNLFRASPGHLEDITIDTMGPINHEKELLIDRVPEQANKPIIKPPVEDTDAVHEESESIPINVGREVEESSSSKSGHRRTTSDIGPSGSTIRRKKAPRRRIVELSQAQQQAATINEASLSYARVPELTELPPMPHTPTTESDPPTTPEGSQVTRQPSLAVRPKLETAFASPTRPRIRNASDDDNSPVHAAEDLDSDLYRQKIETLKSELGPNWLAAWNEELANARARHNRSFSPTSKTNVRPDHPGRGITVVGGRTLG